MWRATKLLAGGAIIAVAMATASASPSSHMAQGGVTIGPRNDLGPRYDPYSESWKTYRPPPPCEWVTVQTLRPDGKIVQEKKWGCRVPARDF